MNTDKNRDPLHPGAKDGAAGENEEAAEKERPTPFTPSELAAAAERPGDPELEDVSPAEIEDRSSEAEVSPEKLVQKARRLSPDRARCILQSLLFVADKPLTVQVLQETTGMERSAIVRSLETLAAAHREGVSGIVLTEVAGGWQLRTDPASAEYVRRFLRVKPQRLTRAAVETLAIIAYRQPVTRPEMEDIRGVDCGAVVKALLERKLIKILGRKEEVGRPILYGTTREFLEFFALRDLASLPTLREFQELSQEHQELVEKDAPAPISMADLIDPEARSGGGERSSPESDAALAELEAAIATADERSKTAGAILSAADPPRDENADAPKPS